MKQSRIDFIKEAHEAACSEWKQRIENEFPKLFEQKFKVGDWVVHPHFMYVERVEKVCGDEIRYSTGEFDYSESLRKATPEEIKTHLIKEAKRRGFEKGVQFKPLHGTGCGFHSCKYFKYYQNHDRLVDNISAIVYEKGQWAEIIEETLDGKQIEIEGKKYKLTLL